MGCKWLNESDIHFMNYGFELTKVSDAGIMSGTVLMTKFIDRNKTKQDN